MTGSAYTMADFASGNNPGIRNEVIEAGIKLLYNEKLGAKELLRNAKLTSSITTTVEEEGKQGGIDWLTEGGTFPELDFAFKKSTRAVKPYGYKFTVTREQVLDDHVDEIKVMIDRAANTLRKWEDNIIFNRIMTASTINTGAASAYWSGDSADPITDIGAAIDAVTDATDGTEPDTIVLSNKAFQYLTAQDVIKNANYNRADPQGYAISGELGKVMGLKVVKNNNVDPSSEGKCLILKAKDIGTWEERESFRTMSTPGLSLGRPDIDAIYYGMARADANIKFPKLGYVMTGLWS